MFSIKFKNLINNEFIFSIALLIGLISVQEASAQKSIFDAMSYQEVLSVTLEADFTAIDTSRRTDNKYKGVLTFEDENGKQQNWNVSLKNRGNFRRLRCEMAPLKINFKKKELKAAGFSKFDDMKLVTHCLSSKSAAKDLLQREYLAYKLYNELTEYSFRVQLLRINYVDISTGKKTKHWAFLIEDTAEMKDRIGATASVEKYLNLPRDTFHDGMVKIASLFQYLIGNSDWDIQGGRNVKYVIRNEKVIPVPYDFDFSGLVNASYAIPNPNYAIPTVKTRIYLGPEEDIDNMRSTLSYFKSKRLDLVEIVSKFKVLSEDSRIEIIDYLNSFYTSMSDIVVGRKVSHGPVVSGESVGAK